MTACLLILNYNGREHLKECLPSALEAAKQTGFTCPVVVVDNCSSEDDAVYVRHHFPQVDFRVVAKNDFLFSYNEVVAERKEEVVVLLNNDLRLEASAVAVMLRHFTNPDVFAVTAKMMNWDGSQVLGARRVGYFKNFWFYRQWDFEPLDVCESLDFCGGSAALRRDMFLRLGGFDRLFSPGYFEDTDLASRAQKKGWKVLYEPAAVVYHKKSATFGKVYKADELTQLLARNEAFFALKNCGNLFFAVIYGALLPLRALRSYLKGNKAQGRGFFEAFLKMGLAIAARCRAKG